MLLALGTTAPRAGGGTASLSVAPRMSGGVVESLGSTGSRWWRSRLWKIELGCELGGDWSGGDAVIEGGCGDGFLTAAWAA
jgi:hypothetical protein